MPGNLLKKVSVNKAGLRYFFIGGMVYNDKFSFDTGSKNQYPFNTYYVYRAEDIEEDGVRYRSLIYCKLPLLCLQFEDHCKCIEFDLPARCGKKDIIPFVGLEETGNSYEIIFRYFPEITIKEKKEAWLGFAKKRKLRLPKGPVVFKTKIYEKETWQEAVMDFFKKHKISPGKVQTDELIPKIKKALFRSFDNELGVFLQLPWSDSTGFCMDKYSYSFPGFDAKRMNYFQELYEKTGDPDYRYWSESLEKHFLNPKIQKNTKNGFIWSNNTHFDGVKLRGLSYLNVGYAGYPPGQATISFNIGQYLLRKENKELKRLLKKNLEYIINTQRGDGSWPAAIAYKFRWRSWKNSEGSTAECARSLMLGYRIFKEAKYRECAKKALDFLDKDYIICRNVLRDIGIDEPEGFSAIIASEAFLDAYELFKDKKHLKSARNYAHHLLTYYYWHGNLKGHFHPITESITPRISPFESLMAVNLYKRLYRKTGEKIWDRLADYFFKKVCEVKNADSSLSEGIFPGKGGLNYLPMEQTFATTEFLYTAFNYGSCIYREPIKEKIKIKDAGDFFLVEDFIKIGKKDYSIKINENNFDILILGPYRTASRLYTEISKSLRKLGFLNAARDAVYLVKGTRRTFFRKPSKETIKKHLKRLSVNADNREVVIKLCLDFHEIKMIIYKSEKIKMDMTIRVKEHDLVCNKVTINGMDCTLDTNWTNGGLFKKTIELE